MKEAMRKTIAVSSDFRESGGVERGTIVDLVVLVVKEVVGDGEDGLGDLQRMSMGEYPDKEWTKDFDREREWKEWKEREGECTALRSTSRAQISAAQNKLGPFLTTGFVNDNSIDA
nr:hypothetical protein Iba_chr04eCG11170 [Ipomoea batatas]